MLHNKEKREACTTRVFCLKRYLSLCSLALRDIR